jgi:multiple sugar transport system substrate-binding protein
MPARRRTSRTPDVYDFQVTGKVGLRRQARGRHRHHHADQGQVPQEHDRDDVPVQRQDQEEGVLRHPDEAADDAHPVLEGHAGEAGFKESDIPTTWKAYWDFWCDKVQPAHRSKTGKRTYAIGQPMGVDSSDSFYSFLTFMDAYNVKLVDDNGKLLVDDPKVRAGLINALRDYTSIRTRGCTPPSSTSWKDPDNNVSFHNKTILMTHNATISIAAKWLDDANNTTLTTSSARRRRRTTTS